VNPLRDALWASEAPPRSRQACDATVRLAHAAAVTSAPSPARFRHWGWRVASLGACVMALLAATPQGRDAASWAGELVGIGEVGGPPASEIGDDFEPSRGPIVFATGTAPNGEPFELFAYRTADIGTGDPVKAGTCVATRAPGTEDGTGTTCFSQGPTEREVRIYELSFARGSDLGVLSGEVNLAADAVTVDYADEGGQRRTLDATVADLSGELGERIAIPNPTSFFVAFLPGVTDIDDICSYGITVTATDGEGGLIGTDKLDEPCGADRAARELLDQYRGR
jgi:hypothetical protein